MARKRKQHIADPEKRWARRNKVMREVAKREAVAKSHAHARRLNKEAAKLPEVHLV